MKKKMLLFSIPFVLLAVFFSHGFLPFLLLPIIIIIVNYLVDRKENNPVLQEMKGRLFHSVEEVEQEYGKPDSVVVLPFQHELFIMVSKVQIYIFFNE